LKGGRKEGGNSRREKKRGGEGKGREGLLLALAV